MKTMFVLMLAIALGVGGWVLPAEAGKVAMTDQELDGVSAGDVAVATGQSGLGSGSSSASDGSNSARVSVVVSSPPLANQVCIGVNIVCVSSTDSRDLGISLGLVGDNIAPLGIKKTKADTSATRTPGGTEIGCRQAGCIHQIPVLGSLFVKQAKP